MSARDVVPRMVLIEKNLRGDPNGVNLELHRQQLFHLELDVNRLGTFERGYYRYLTAYERMITGLSARGTALPGYDMLQKADRMFVEADELLADAVSTTSRRAMPDVVALIARNAYCSAVACSTLRSYGYTAGFRLKDNLSPATWRIVRAHLRKRNSLPLLTTHERNI